jgi:anti-anti-sigma factor
MADKPSSMGRNDMEIRLSETTEQISIGVHGDLDLSSVTAFRTAVNKALAEREGRGLTIDLRETDYIDSAGLEQLLVANRKLSVDGERLLVLVQPGRQPQTVLSVTGFNAIMDVEPALEPR